MKKYVRYDSKKIKVLLGKDLTATDIKYGITHLYVRKIFQKTDISYPPDTHPGGKKC